MSQGNDFFDCPEERSLVKAAVVSKYFFSWSTVMLKAAQNQAKKNPHSREHYIAYLDFYSGPGKYDDGTFSTPLLVLQKAQEVPGLCERLLCYFNDAKEDNIKKLEENIEKEFPNLLNKPFYSHSETGEKHLELLKNLPDYISSFSFFDPFGYKGTSRKIIAASLRQWGSEVVFLFNYNRIRAAINNPLVEEHVRGLFGDRIDTLREMLTGKNRLPSDEAEPFIMSMLCDSIRTIIMEEQNGAQVIILPLCFKNKKRKGTSHYIIFVTKHVLGFKIMKDVMAKEVNSRFTDTDSFTYVPVKKDAPYAQGNLFAESEKTLGSLRVSLLEHFSGRTIRTEDLIDEHTVKTLFITKDYKEVLYSLYTEKEISVDRRPSRKNSFADDIVITFPKR